MSKIQEELVSNKTVTNSKLLDYIIGVQLGKIERYNNDASHVLDSNSEEAMKNLIELLKLRKKTRNND